MAPYRIRLISRKQKEKLFSALPILSLLQSKAEIHGACIKLFTDSKNFHSLWRQNFSSMPENIRPHGRLFAVSSKYGKVGTVLYEPVSSTAFIFGSDYYGLVKSVALAIVADYLEDSPSEHRRYSIHGSFISKGADGIGIIGVSGSGKTTLTYGLMLDKQFSFLTDDWIFVRIFKDCVMAYSSEANSYIRADLAHAWPQYGKRLKLLPRDAHGRKLVDVKKFFGSTRVRRESKLRAIVLLERVRGQPPFRKLARAQALAYLAKNDYCNPHQLVHSSVRMRERKEFFSHLLSRVPCYLLNTIESPEGSLARLRRVYSN